jgi:hypothetical protein
MNTSDSASAENEADYKEYEEQEEQDSRDIGGRAGDSAKAEHTRDNRYDQEYDSPI